ncbi:hypothetical protein AVEN_162132-1 [Araneus ventricosus]|uniref:Uncharacterized protein n=1 Tax=Araneus ventricosus TaxID=182803 RepID=A0A4Y2NXH9_ARAVE|nr:hypothetical protein AVEN_162132-1 [Araneus ventricosus]
MQIVQKLLQRVAFAEEMLSRIENEHDFLIHRIFAGEATSHVSNKVNISTTAEIGAQNIPTVYRKLKEKVRKSMFCALSHDTVIEQFFFSETSVTANILLDILQIYAIPQMQHLLLTVIFQKDAGVRMLEHFAETGLPAALQRDPTWKCTDFFLELCEYCFLISHISYGFAFRLSIVTSPN